MEDNLRSQAVRSLILELALHLWLCMFVKCPVQIGDQPMVQDVRVTVLVTDSNSGIGKVCAQQPAKRGIHVILSGRNKARGDAASAESGRPEGRPTSLPPTRRTQPRPRPLRDNPPNSAAAT